MIGTVPAGVKDLAFEFEVFVSVRLAEMARLADPEQPADPAGFLREAELEALLRRQFEAQREAIRECFPGARHEIVLYGDSPIGRMVTEETASAVRLIDLALIKPYRGLGIGSRLVRGLKRHAGQAGKPVKLTLQPDHPALRLFLRQGFKLFGRTEDFLALVWEPGVEELAAIAD